MLTVLEASHPFGGKERSVDPERSDPIYAKKSWAGVYPAPEFPTGMDWLNTKEPLHLASLRGKIVLLDFWTYGCINCIHNLPDLARLQEDFPNELVVIGVHSAKFTNEGRLKSLRNILLRYEITHPVVNDPDFVIWQIWGPQAWPTLVLIDPVGKISAVTMGEGFYPQFKEIIQSLKEEFLAKGLLNISPWRNLLKPPEVPSSLLRFPGKVRVSPVGDAIFVSDSGNHRIIQVDERSGKILQVVGGNTGGFTDGTLRTARFRNPQGIAVAPDGNTIFVADTGNHAIRRIDLGKQLVTTIAGIGKQSVEYPPPAGKGTLAALSSPWDLELEGNTLYIAMAGSHQIWKMDLASQSVTPLAGSGAEGFMDGAGSEAELAQPSGLSLGKDGRLYFADSEGSSIRYVEVHSKDLQVGTLAGSGNSLFEFGAEDGVGTEARFQHPLGVRFHNGTVYVADTYNHRIRAIDPRTQKTWTLGGTDSGFRDGKDPQLDEPGGIDAKGSRLYVADTNNHSLRVVNLEDGTVSTLVIENSKNIFPGGGVLFNKALPPLRLEKETVSPGKGEVSLLVEFPKGYKPSAEVFSTFTVDIVGGVGRFLGTSPLNIQGPSFPLRIPFEFQPGTGMVVLELSIAYCAEEKVNLCFIDKRRIELPLEVKLGTSRQVALKYEVTQKF